MYSYLVVAADAPSDTFQFAVADLSELVLRHGNDSVTLGDELTAVANKEAVVARERLQDLCGYKTMVGMDQSCS